MPRKQRSTWGNLTKLDKNVYRIRYWGDKLDGKGYRRLSKTVHGTRREAENEMAKLRINHSEDAPCPTFKQAAEMWYVPEMLARIEEGTLAQTTFDTYRRLLKYTIYPAIGDIQINDLKPLAIQEWLMTLTKYTAKRVLNVGSAVIDFAIRYEEIDTNVFKQKYRIPGKVYEHDKGVYTLEELKQVADMVHGTVFEIPFVLAAFGSCRPAESLGAEVSDVKAIEAHQITFAAVYIHQQIDRNGDIKTTLKTKSSTRWVIIPPPYADWVFEAAKNNKQWLAQREDGSHLSRFFIETCWSKFMKQYPNVPFHNFRNLRNSWRTFMAWDLDMPPEKLEKMMGHTGSNVGEIHYNRPSEELFAEAYGEALEKLDRTEL